MWKIANVSAIYQKGERFKASNYRPVSLTCISCKMFEHIIVSNIMRHLDKNDILTDCQHGCRSRRICETQLLTLTDELIKTLDKGKQHDLAVFDFSKAFDRVPMNASPSRWSTMAFGGGHWTGYELSWQTDYKELQWREFHQNQPMSRVACPKAACWGLYFFWSS